MQEKIRRRLKLTKEQMETLVNYLKYLKLSDDQIFEIFQDLLTWKKIVKSPHSCSFYSDKVSWGKKPEGSFRISNHWNFETESDDMIHCPTHSFFEGWALAKFTNGKYELIKKY